MIQRGENSSAEAAEGQYRRTASGSVLHSRCGKRGGPKTACVGGKKPRRKSGGTSSFHTCGKLCGRRKSPAKRRFPMPLWGHCGVLETLLCSRLRQPRTEGALA